MNTDDPVLKKISKIALAALGVLVVFSALFYKQRMFFADDAYILFNIVNTRSLSIQEYRYGSFITQLVPWLAEKMHLPLRAIAVLYSSSFNLFYFTVASLLVYRFRQYGLAIIMALYYFLFVSESFFWTNNEIHQAIAWMFLLFGVTLSAGRHKPYKPLFIISFAILSFLTVFTHFVVVIPTLFLWVYLILEKQNWPHTRGMTIFLSSIIAAALMGKYFLSNVDSSSYESGHLHNLTHFSLRDLISTFTSPVVSAFAGRCIVNYWLAVIVFFFGIGTLAKNRKWSLVAWSLTSAIGYIVIMGLAYQDQPANILLFHIESEWASLAIIAGYPFVCAFLPHRKRWLSAAVLASVFAVRLIYIYAALPGFTVRQDINERILAQMRKKGITKLGLVNDEHIIRANKLAWALPFESIMISELAGDKPQVTFFFFNPDDTHIRDVTSHYNGFFDSYSMIPASSLNPAYFSIDTTGPYQIMTYDALMR